MRPGYWIVAWAVALAFHGVWTARAAEPATTQPFTVVGTITDGSGKPVEGVEIWAACGSGTLLPTGQTTSGRDGRYRLTFGPGLRVQRNGGWGVGTQAATISARHGGYFEKNLGRQGDLLMSDEPSPARYKAAGIVRPNQPYTVNFVMLPAATIDGQLLDTEGRPIADRLLYINTKPLPPSSSVLSSATTDTEGRFRFSSLPTRQDLWFQMTPPGERRDLTSAPFRCEKPAMSRFAVKVIAGADDKGSLQATALPPTEARP